MTTEKDSEKVIQEARELCRAVGEADQVSQKLAVTMDQDADKVNKLKNAFNELGGNLKKDFITALNSSIKSGDNFFKVFDKLKDTLEDFVVKFAIVDPLENILFGATNPTLGNLGDLGKILPPQGQGGLFGDILGGLADFIGLRATGGPVALGAPYIVGEHGPELFVPNAAGRIAPNVSAAAPIHITMNIATSDAGSFRASQTQIAAQMMDAARRAQRIR